jgi:hypothetical protein
LTKIMTWSLLLLPISSWSRPPVSAIPEKCHQCIEKAWKMSSVVELSQMLGVPNPRTSGAAASQPWPRFGLSWMVRVMR